MAKYHKHEGVKGSHLITSKHKDEKTQHSHKVALNSEYGVKAKKIEKSTKFKVNKGTYTIDLTKEDNINVLIVKGKDKNGKKYTVEFKKY